MNTYRGFDNRQTDLSKLWKDIRARSSCGIQALHHGRLLLGQPSELHELFRAASLIDNVFHGHVGDQLKQVAKTVRFRMNDLTTSDLPRLRRDLNRCLRQGLPVVLGSNAAAHWLVVAGFDEDGRYILVDSADAPITGIWDWDDMKEWLDEADAPYEAFALQPQSPQQLSRSMVPNMATLWQRLGEDTELAGRWGELLAELDQIFDFGKTSGAKLEAGAFFQRNTHAILQPISWESPRVDETAAYNLYTEFWTVAESHNLRMPACFEAHAVAHMALVMHRRLS